jgi:GT2 family glycosyltransferase
MKPRSQTAGVVIVTYNSKETIGTVLAALLADPDRPEQVIVVDNGSIDTTREIVASFDVKLVEAPANIGFGAGCHLGATHMSQDVIVVLGHDTVPRAGWLGPLVSALDDPSVGAAMATIEDAQRPGHFNTSGGHLTYFGLAWLSEAGDQIADEFEIVDVAFPSGAAMAMQRVLWDRFGGFRSEFFMYHEDSDLGWRLRLSGLRTVRVAGSLVEHHYEFGRNPNKMFWLERNRILMILSNYRRRTLIILSPALLAVEIGVTLMALRDQWLPQKVRAWRALWRERHLVGEGRVLAQRNRRTSDADLLASLEYQVSTASQVALPGGAALVGQLLGLYRRMALPVVRLVERLG